MSFLLRSSRVAVRCAVLSSSRPFTASTFRALKEGDRHRDDQAEENEKHKQDSIKKQKEGNAHWKPELASNSEEAVAADRHAGNESIEEMQKKTADHAEKKHKHGTSQDPGL